MITDGVTIVISPLKSLIHDQIKALKIKNIPCISITGESKINDIYMFKDDIENAKFKLIYTTPETISKNIIISEIIINLQNNNKLDRFVIDEAHCISGWGNDFRSTYRDLSKLKKIYKKVPIMALTATATQKVRLDIVKLLNFKEYREYTKSYFRPNLKIVVKEKNKNSYFDVVKIINSNKNNSGIIYCISRKKCDDLAMKLRNNGINAESYHAGLSDKQRIERQNNWFENKTIVIIATVAFGMGIDKNNVRYVIHYNMPSSLENYYQEIGRAGRDGLSSDCILYFNGSDKVIWNTIIGNNDETYNKHKRENIKKMYDYCENSIDCRHDQLCQYLGDNIIMDNCNGSCDNCSYEKKIIDITDISKIIFQTIIDLGFDSYKDCIDNRIKKNSKFRNMNIDEKDYRRVFLNLIRNKYIKEIVNTNDESSLWREKYKLFGKSKKVLDGNEKISINMQSTQKKSQVLSGIISTSSTRVYNSNSNDNISQNINLDDIDIKFAEFTYKLKS